MGYVVIGFAFGIVMIASAIGAGLGLWMSLVVGWLGASLGIMAVVALAILRQSDAIHLPASSLEA